MNKGKMIGQERLMLGGMRCSCFYFMSKRKVEM